MKKTLYGYVFWYICIYEYNTDFRLMILMPYDGYIYTYIYTIIIMVSRSTWMTTKINGIATDLFCTGVIDHPAYNFLN